MLTVGDKFPTFALTAVKGGKEGLGGPGVSFTEITNETDAGKWKIVFFWPKDFTFICPTEIAAFGKLAGEFADRDAVLAMLANPGADLDGEAFAAIADRLGADGDVR